MASPARTYIPQSLLLQWHITNRCNLRCAHCYQSEYGGAEHSLQDLIGLVQQYQDLLTSWRRATPNAVRGQITVTGGEPMVRSDFMDLLKEFALRREHFRFAILTNGNLVTPEMARFLAEVAPRFVQVSIEGTEATHNAIRGPGNYRRVVGGVRALQRAGVRTFIPFTAHRGNYREFSDVARLGRELGVGRVWTDRLIPSGSGSQLSSMVLTKAETREFCLMVAQERQKKSWRGGTEIAAHRALQFLVAGGEPYHCTAGDTLLTVMPNGDLYPCRRMPVRIGNVFETPLAQLYYESPLLQRLRNPASTSSQCGGCCFKRMCRGGLKCLSYAVYGDPFRPDPGCWLQPG